MPRRERRARPVEPNAELDVAVGAPPQRLEHRARPQLPLADARRELLDEAVIAAPDVEPLVALSECLECGGRRSHQHEQVQRGLLRGVEPELGDVRHFEQRPEPRCRPGAVEPLGKRQPVERCRLEWRLVGNLPSAEGLEIGGDPGRDGPERLDDRRLTYSRPWKYHTCFFTPASPAARSSISSPSSFARAWIARWPLSISSPPSSATCRSSKWFLNEKHRPPNRSCASSTRTATPPWRRRYAAVESRETAPDDEHVRRGRGAMRNERH